MKTSPEQAQSQGQRPRLRPLLYRWHKIIGIASLIPVFFWTLSGMMHPFMAHWFKPRIAREVLPTEALDSSLIALSLQQVLLQNNLMTFKNFRLVRMDDIVYYQIKTVEDSLRYFHAKNAGELPDGDRRYAQWLARYFLDDQQSPVRNVSLQRSFDQSYKYINRLLPVWKVDFERPDDMTLYVETATGRLASFHPASRKAFILIFDIFHNWSFLEYIASPWVKTVLMLLLLGTIMLSAISGLGIYGLMWKRFKKTGNMQGAGLLRRYHRQIGLATALVTLTFAFSGAWHAINKYSFRDQPVFVYSPVIEAEQLSYPSHRLPVHYERLLNLSLVKMHREIYYQVQYAGNEEKQQAAETLYLHARDAGPLEQGDIRYARFLVQQFSQTNRQSDCCEPVEEPGNNSVTPVKAAVLHRFNREYGFIFKRLPVVELSYNIPGQSSYYVETATSHLAARIDNADRREGFAFAVFHKFFFMDWAGKNIRDMVMLISALGVFVVSIFGLAVLVKK